MFLIVEDTAALKAKVFQQSSGQAGSEVKNIPGMLTVTNTAGNKDC